MTTRRRPRPQKTVARRRRPAGRARSVELRQVIRLQGLSGRALRGARIRIAVEPASLFRTLP